MAVGFPGAYLHTFGAAYVRRCDGSLPAQDIVRLRLLRARRRASQPEVRDLHFPVGLSGYLACVVEEDVQRLQVAVRDVPLVQVGDARDELLRHAVELRQREGRARVHVRVERLIINRIGFGRLILVGGFEDDVMAYFYKNELYYFQF